MKYYANSKPSHGVAFKPWVDRVRELLDESEILLPQKHELIQYYHANLSYEEVLRKEQFKNFKAVWMEVNVKLEKEVFNERFNTSAQAKEFFKKFPELRAELDR